MCMMYIHFDNILVLGDNERVASLSSLDTDPPSQLASVLHQLKSLS